MKQYKLLKDLPTFKAGDEFYIDSNNNLRLKGSDSMAYNHYTLEKFPNILKDWFEEVPEEHKRRRAEMGDLYHFINDCGDINYGRDHNNPWDNYRHKTGNYGLTKEELEAKREYDIARQVLLDDAKGGKWKKNGINLCVYYENGINRWIFDNTIRDIQISGAIYFQNRADTQKSLKEHKDQWEIVRKYEMGEIE
nr:MAG TPA: hypothetical protein [Caudoviricetes sp.]